MEGSSVVFTISLDNASFKDIVLNLNAATGSATAVTDFETTNFEFFDGMAWQPATSGTQVRINAGQTSLMVRIDSVQDGDVEPDETFTLGASVVSGTVTSATDTGTGTIVNDDNALISIDDVTVDEDNGTLVFTVSLDQSPTGTVSVNYATAVGGSATSGIDFDAAMGMVTFNAGEQTKTISITINDDNLYEQSESFDVNLSGASGGTITDGTGVGTIIDDGSGPNGTDDDRPVISIDDVTATEDVDSHAVFTISLSNPSTEAIVLSLAINDGTATSGSDYGPGLEFFDGMMWQPVAGNITIAADETNIQVRTAIIDDAITDDNETFAIVATQISGTTFNSGDTGTGTILDDPTPDVTNVSITGPGSVSEGSLATYTVTLDNLPLTDVTVTFSYSGTATGGTDYSGVASVTIPGGSLSTMFDIATIDDTLGEDLENFIVTIDSVSGGSLEDLQISPINNSVTTNIVDDDIPAIAVNDVFVTEGDDTHAEFTVEISNPTFEDISFSISAVGVSATGETTDFGILGLEELEVFDGMSWIPATAATIAAGETTLRMRTPIVDDVAAEGMETFTVTVTTTMGTTSNASSSGTGTIQDDMMNPDTVMVSLVGPGLVVEGATTTDYTLTLNNPLTMMPIDAIQDVTVTLTYTGTAADGADYTGVATVLIPSGSNSGTFTLPTVDDALYEGTENIIVTIETVTGGGFEGIAADMTADSVTTMITDTADIPTVAINDVTSVEGTDDFAVFTIELSNLSVEDVDLILSLADATATGGGVDYGSGGTGNLQVFDGMGWVDATTATIAAGEFSVQVRVPIVNDVIDEPNESFNLTVDVDAGTTTNIQVIGAVTIIDDDQAPDITIDDGTTSEGDPLVFNVTLSNPSSTPIVLDFAATDGTATSANDYNAAFEFSTDGGMSWLAATGGSEVTIPANSTSVMVRLMTTEDMTLESTETMQIAIDSVISGSVGNTSDTATGTINDDDSSMVSISGDNIVNEGNVANYTVSMSNPSDTDTVVAYLISGTADNGVDFATLGWNSNH